MGTVTLPVTLPECIACVKWLFVWICAIKVNTSLCHHQCVISFLCPWKKYEHTLRWGLKKPQQCFCASVVLHQSFQFEKWRLFNMAAQDVAQLIQYWQQRARNCQKCRRRSCEHMLDGLFVWNLITLFICPIHDASLLILNRHLWFWGIQGLMLGKIRTMN